MVSKKGSNSDRKRDKGDGTMVSKTVRTIAGKNVRGLGQGMVKIC